MSRVVQLLLVAVAVVGLTVTAQAQSIAINFGANEPDVAGTAVVSGPAGIHGIANWNNFEGNAGGVEPLVDDSGAATMAGVEWSSENTWASVGRSETNNSALPSEDGLLMQGYLDTNNTSVTTVTVAGLGPELTGPGYNVVVYALGGVPGRGGDYSILGETQTLVGAGEFDGNYIKATDGNYMVFGPFNDASFQLTGTPTTPAGGTMRAPLNAIEINPIPEPATFVLLAGAALLGLGLFWRRKK